MLCNGMLETCLEAFMLDESDSMTVLGGCAPPVSPPLSTAIAREVNDSSDLRVPHHWRDSHGSGCRHRPTTGFLEGARFWIRRYLPSVWNWRVRPIRVDFLFVRQQTPGKSVRYPRRVSACSFSAVRLALHVFTTESRQC